jgi:hypothetical protein
MHELTFNSIVTPNSPWVSKTDRFEVDGGLGAVKFIKTHKNPGVWDDFRFEKLYDGIALHGSPGLGKGKNLDTVWALNSIGYDNPGARPAAVPEKDYNNILKLLPADDIVSGTNTTWVWFAATKPEATYNTLVEPFGTAVSTSLNQWSKMIYTNSSYYSSSLATAPWATAPLISLTTRRTWSVE